MERFMLLCILISADCWKGCYSIDATRPPTRQAEEAENGPKAWVTNPATAYGHQRGVSDPTPGLGQKKKGMWGAVLAGI